MDEEDFLPKPKFEPKILDDLSVDELREYIVELQVEIARVKQDISTKESHRHPSRFQYYSRSAMCRGLLRNVQEQMFSEH